MIDLQVDLDGGLTRVRMGSDILGQSGHFLAGLGLQPTRLALVADGRLDREPVHLVLDSLADEGFEAHHIRLEGGEKCKTLATVETLASRFGRLRLDRRSLVVALGGGSISDVVGFAASVWMRGINWAVIPTTLLSMSDASLGGKTAVNLNGTKNLIGAFHQPAGILMDTEWLARLPEREFRSGMGEVVKTAILGGLPFFEFLEQSREALQARDTETCLEAISQSVGTKAVIVSADERERGPRRILNLGHTVGHGIERASPQLRHGEAVALGLIASCAIACERQRMAPQAFERIKALLEAYRLPTRLPGDLDVDRVLDAMTADKKRAGGEIVMILPREIGEVEIVEGIPPGEVRGVLSRMVR